MHIEKITYSRTFNIGNYESEKIEVTAYLDSDDSPIDVLGYLKEWVMTRFLERLSPVESTDRAKKH